MLITDTVGDVREGRSCGVRVIGVAWGMHGVDALRQAGAETVVMWPQELLTPLLPGGEPGHGRWIGLPVHGQRRVPGPARLSARRGPAAPAPAAGWPVARGRLRQPATTAAAT